MNEERLLMFATLCCLLTLVTCWNSLIFVVTVGETPVTTVFTGLAVLFGGATVVLSVWVVVALKYL